jgi:hypothetical protein
MDRQQELGAIARAIIDANWYMALGTADETGRPWVSPVYFAAAGYSEFLWVSSPEATHSRNIAARPEVSIVVFDSRAPVGTGQGMYMSALAEELTGAELDRGIEVFARCSQEQGGRVWSAADVRPPALYRLYRATAMGHSVLDPDRHPDGRTPVIV